MFVLRIYKRKGDSLYNYIRRRRFNSELYGHYEEIGLSNPTRQYKTERMQKLCIDIAMHGKSVCLVVLFGVGLIGADFQTNVNEITEEITRYYYRDFGCLTYITEDSEDSLPSLFHRIINTLVIFVNLNSTAGSTTILEDIYNVECRGFVVRVRDRSYVISKMLNAYKKSLYSRYNNKRYLFLPYDETDTDTDFLLERNMFFLPDLVFASPMDNATGFDLLAHNYFNGYKYDILHEKYEVLDTWLSGVGFQSNVTLFPDRMSDLSGKEMIFALMQYGPYTIIIRNGGEIEYDGVETRIAAIFAEKKNATWTGKDHPVHLWGDIFENGTSNGAIGSVYEHTADIGFAAIYQWHCDTLECSYPYIYAGVTCLVPKPRLISGWYTIVLPFEPSVWEAILSSYIACSVFVFFMTITLQKIKYGRVSGHGYVSILLESLFSTFRVQLEQTPRDTGAKTPITAFLKIWMLYSFFVAASWQGGIASFLTVPMYEKPINEPEDLIERWPKIEWGGNHIDWTKSISQTTESVLLNIVKKFRVLNDDSLRKRVRARNFGHFMERLPNGHYGINEYLDEEAMKYLRIMESNFYIGHCVMILPKCSPYLEGLDKILFWMFDTGLIQKLEIQTSLEKMNNRLQNMIRTSGEKQSTGDIALLVGHIQGAIFIYTCGTLLSLLVFLLEIYANRRKCMRPEKTRNDNILFTTNTQQIRQFRF